MLSVPLCCACSHRSSKLHCVTIVHMVLSMGCLHVESSATTHTLTYTQIQNSQALDLYKALKCFFFEFWDLDSEAPPAQLENATLSTLGRILTPACVTMPHATRLCMVRVDTGKVLVQEVLPLAPKWTSPRDVLLVNFGLHHGARDQYSVWFGLVGHLCSVICRNMFPPTADQLDSVCRLCTAAPAAASRRVLAANTTTTFCRVAG